jgi:uncharacterized membrane protein HdeD (DUF308 family)
MRTQLYKNWWLLSLKGLLIIVLGLMVLVSRNLSSEFFSWITGMIITVSGIAIIFGSISHRKYNYEWTWWFLEGLIDILFGVLIMVNPQDALSLIIVLISLWAIIMGIIKFITAINIQFYVSTIFIFLFTGIVAFILGILMLMNREAGLEGIRMQFGIYGLYYGISDIYISFLLKRVEVEEIGELEEL